MSDTKYFVSSVLISFCLCSQTGYTAAVMIIDAELNYYFETLIQKATY
jgi:hypothetical protein